MLALETRSGHLASAISGNQILQPISVRDFPRPERGVLIVQIIFLQNNLFIFNLLSDCLQPHNTTTHTTKPHPAEPYIPTTVCYIVIISIIFLWYKTIFSTDHHCVSLYINKEKQKITQGIPCLRPQLLHDLTQLSPKHEIFMHFMKRKTYN